MDRRRLLATVLDNGVWLPYTFDYIYHSLVPDTISTKQVKNKSRLTTILGEGCVENQMLQNGNFVDDSSWGIIDGNNTHTISNNEIWFTATQNISSWSDGGYVSQSKKLIANHTYLITCEVYTEQAGNCGFYYGGAYDTYIDVVANQWQRISSIRTQSSDNTDSCQLSPFFTAGMTEGQKHAFRNFMLIDLTQMFPYNVPSSLSDNRVKNLINRGYVDYNKGKIKWSQIKEIQSFGNNLLDLTGLVEGALSLIDGTIVTNPNRCVSQFIPVSTGSYSFKHTINDYWKCCYYDKNQHFVSALFDGTTSQVGIAIPLDGFIRIGWDSDLSTTEVSEDMVVVGSNVPSTFVPYRDTGLVRTIATVPGLLELSGSGSHRDAFDIDSSNYVFTKKNKRVDLGTLNWSYAGSNLFYTTLSDVLTTPDSMQAFIMCSGYAPSSRNGLADKQICISGTDVVVYDSVFTNPNLFKIAVKREILQYPLVTNQVITIPRGHLRYVDLGTLNWFVQNSGTANERIFTDELTNLKQTATTSTSFNVFSIDYMTSSYDASDSNDKIIFGYREFQSYNRLFIRDLSITNNATPEQIKEKLSGRYIYYESSDSVSDFINDIYVEPNGTVSNNLFHWWQLVPNGNFATVGNWSSTTSDLINIDEYELTLTTGIEEYGDDGHSVAETLPSGSMPVMPGKHLICFSACSLTAPNGTVLVSMASKDSFPYSNMYSIDSGAISLTNTYQEYAVIVNPTGSLAIHNPRTTIDITFYDANAGGQVGDVYKIKDLRIINLDQVFGTGSSDTITVSGPRIQQIIKYGYSPENVEVSVGSDVLPTVWLNIKCK